MVNAQTWLGSIPSRENAKTIYGTNDYLKQNLQGTNIQELDGDLTIDGLVNLEELGLIKTRKLDNVTIRNCPKLRIINLGDSGIKNLNLGPGLDGLLKLDIGITSFTIDPFRKLNELNLSQVKNLKVLKCHGGLTTKLIGFEKLIQLQHFDTSTILDDKNVVLIPTKEFNKWKEQLDIITGPSGLDLLKGGLGLDKDDVDLAKLNGYKNRPIQDQLNKELNKIKNLLGVGVNDPLPADWETKLAKKTDLEAANHKIKEYGDGLKADLNLSDSTLPTWRSEITKLKNRPTSSNSGIPITKEQWDKDYSQRPTRRELEKVEKLHNAIRDGVINRFGKNAWKTELEVEKYYNQIEKGNF